MANIEHIRHSFAHVLAQAVLKLYPNAKLGIGPAIENGFYYDFDNVEISENDLPKIEKEMKKILSQDLAFKKEMWSVERAKKYFKKQPYKLELIRELSQKSKVGIVHTGDQFTDLCRGGHIKNTKELNPDAFKLTSVAGAYWRGDENNDMLTRIYGVAFETEKELNEHLTHLEEAKKRDHKKLGPQLGLYTTSQLVGAGLPMFAPKGAIIWNLMKEFSEDLKKNIGYKPVHIPHIAKHNLYKVSGHLEKYSDDLFYVKGENSEFILKAMNCPHHTQIYASQERSYRDLPVRFLDTTTVYRDERAGELGGLTRVLSITQDDSHVFCREDQLEKEFDNIIKQIKKVVRAFKLKDYKIHLSLRDEKHKKDYLGDDAVWKTSQKQMEGILKKNNIDFVKDEGEAAFYGPKMDFVVNDSLGRRWQIATIQLDLNMPSRFGLEYTDKNGGKQTPVMIHSAFLGSIERFMGIIIEHFAGAFPVWLAPEQVWVVPVSKKFNSYGKKVQKQLQDAGVRAELRDEDDSLSKKIRNGQTQKIPYLLIVGEKEKSKESVSVRDRKKGDIGSMKVNKFTEKVVYEIEKKQ